MSSNGCDIVLTTKEMGGSTSLLGFMTEDLLDEYIQLTYLNRIEILSLLKKLLLIAPEERNATFEYRYPPELIIKIFPQLKCNPFKDRIFKIFSSLKDDHFSFEDMLDLCSVMSENCPDQVKARWAFAIFDFNEDGMIDKDDVLVVMDRLTQGDNHDRTISNDDKNHIIAILLKAMDIQGNGSITRLEFEHAVGKMPEFSSSFSFKI